MDDDLPNNVVRPPQPPAGTPESELLFGVPMKHVATAQRLMSQAAIIYGSETGRKVLAAIPWMPDLSGFPVTARDFGPRLRRPIPPEDYEHGVPLRYLKPAVGVFRAVVELYDLDEARRYWGKLPHVPDLAYFDPATWVAAKGGKPY
ncbi:MAG: hypothetical protein DI527_02095 [Chelatococcus sp.]|nr:MAG: hypothetical protein DI527_02095 [Chelatococcus sp.]